MSLPINLPPDAAGLSPLHYTGNYVGIVIQNNDPDHRGQIKVWVPHVSPTVYRNWIDSNDDKKFKFIKG